MWAEDRDLSGIMKAALNPFSGTELCTRHILGDAMDRHIQGSNLPLGGNPVIQIVPFLTWEWQRRLGNLSWDTSMGTMGEELGQTELRVVVFKLIIFRLYPNAL